MGGGKLLRNDLLKIGCNMWNRCVCVGGGGAAAPWGVSAVPRAGAFIKPPCQLALQHLSVMANTLRSATLRLHAPAARRSSGPLSPTAPTGGKSSTSRAAASEENPQIRKIKKVPPDVRDSASLL